MSRTQYEIYQKQVFVLAKTLIIKHDEIATSMNNELYWSGYFNEVYNQDPRTWRYYLNMAGEYHQYDTAYLLNKYGTTHMMVQVATDDGFRDVPFVKELFNGENADISLANEFAIGSKLYNEMVNRYPEFESLIIGILNPIDIETAIKAENGEILYIDGFYKQIKGGERKFITKSTKRYNVYTEPQEHNLIDELQRYIYNYLLHWVNAEYIDGNDLYAIVSMGILYTQLPNVIMNIRLGNCKTPYVHSFHVKQYLESFGQLGRYVDFIPFESALWLYRNTIFLESNRGKHLTFNSILRNLWTPNAVPMSAYSIRHNLSNVGRDKLLPTGMLYKEVLNFSIPGISDDDRTVRDILEDQIPLARDNDKDLDLKEEKIQETIDWGGDDRIQTKVLESEMMEMGEPYPFDFDTMLFNLWGYTAYKGYYTGTIYVTHPISGDRIALTPLNAYILAIYCLNIAVANNKLTKIPKVEFHSIPRTNFLPDYPSNKIFEPKPDVEKAYGWCDNTRTRKQKVEEVLGKHNPKFKAANPQTFFRNSEEIFHERVRKYYSYCQTEDFIERGDLHLVAERCYWHEFEETLIDDDYSDWFRKVGVNLDNFQKEDHLKLATELIFAATGMVDDKSLRRRWLQKAMVAILKHFVSYTVHLIEKYADGKVSYLGNQTLRYCNFEWHHSGFGPFRYSIALDYKAPIKPIQPVVLDIDNLIQDFYINAAPNTHIFYNTNIETNIGKMRKPVGTYILEFDMFNLGFINAPIRYDKFPDKPKDVDVIANGYYVSDVFKQVFKDSIDISIAGVDTKVVHNKDPLPPKPEPAKLYTSEYLISDRYGTKTVDTISTSIYDVSTTVKAHPETQYTDIANPFGVYGVDVTTRKTINRFNSGYGYNDTNIKTEFHSPGGLEDVSISTRKTVNRYSSGLSPERVSIGGMQDINIVIKPFPIIPINTEVEQLELNILDVTTAVTIS